MGDVSAAADFCASYQVDISAWRDECADMYSWALTRCPFFRDHTRCDVLIALNIDDTLGIIASFNDHTAGKLRELLLRSDGVLDRHLANGGYSQNRSKQEIVPGIRGLMQNRRFYDFDDVGKVLPALKHLSAYAQMSDTLVIERKQRIWALKAGWCSLSGFWFEKCLIKIKRLQFIARVLAPAINHLDTYITNHVDHHAITAPLTGMLRALMQGKAADNSSGQYKSMSNNAVWRHWRLAPPAVDG